MSGALRSLGWLLAVAIASSCGGDDDDAPSGERCPQAGGLDDGCTCSSEQPLGLRRCLSTLVWSACMCGPPRDQPCMQGEPVECSCPGDSRTYTTTCLGAGTFECPCDERGGASGNGE